MSSVSHAPTIGEGDGVKFKSRIPPPTTRIVGGRIIHETVQAPRSGIVLSKPLTARQKHMAADDLTGELYISAQVDEGNIALQKGLIDEVTP